MVTIPRSRRDRDARLGGSRPTMLTVLVAGALAAPALVASVSPSSSALAQAKDPDAGAPVEAPADHDGADAAIGDDEETEDEADAGSTAASEEGTSDPIDAAEGDDATGSDLGWEPDQWGNTGEGQPVQSPPEDSRDRSEPSPNIDEVEASTLSASESKDSAGEGGLYLGLETSLLYYDLGLVSHDNLIPTSQTAAGLGFAATARLGIRSGPLELGLRSGYFHLAEAGAVPVLGELGARISFDGFIGTAAIGLGALFASSLGETDESASGLAGTFSIGAELPLGRSLGLGVALEAGLFHLGRPPEEGVCDPSRCEEEALDPNLEGHTSGGYAGLGLRLHFEP